MATSRRRVEELFEAALERTRAERDSWLADQCAGDAELLAEVRALLAAHDHTGGIVDGRGEEAAERLLANTRSAGERIGAYRIVDEIGRGGMGTVYLAERADGQFEQRVAIKVIHGGPHADELYGRFEAERQILASLSHPNIARLLDGGLTEEGRPYLVMELVDGQPLDTYCAERGLGVDDRLRLFKKVVQAVHHAHRNLVVHRDLKPSNILVDADGVAKLLDFGIAKILDPSTVQHAVPVTRTGLRLMTPEYASPEQVSGGSVTTATDVYGLGAVLYELLTGRRPFDLKGRSTGEIERIILEEEPLRPSTVVARTARTASETADASGEDRLRTEGVPSAQGQEALVAASLDPIGLASKSGWQRLRRQLRGDLDRIVLMALRKEPERRYASAEQMAEDIERYLDGQPVLAQGASASYRAKKFVSRHRAGVAAAAAIVVALVAGTVVASIGMVRATRAEAVALQEAETARQVSDFLVGLFEVADPNEARANTITAREILDEGAIRIEEELGDQPIVQARLMHTMGNVYRHLGLFDAAIPMLEHAAEVRQSELESGDPDLATSLHALGGVYGNRGRYEEAAPLLRRAVEMREQALGPDHLSVAESLTELSSVLMRQGEFDEAEGHLRRALDIREAALGPDHIDLTLTLTNLGSVHRRRGEYDQAEVAYQRALAIREASLPADHPDIARSLQSLAALYNNQQRLDESEPLILRALEIKEKTVGPDHPEYGNTLASLAAVYAVQGRFSEAEPLLRRALDIYREALGPEHPRVGDTLHNLAFLNREWGRPDESELLFGEALAIKEAALGPDNPRVAATLFSFGDLYLEQERYGEAEPLLRRALAIQEETLPPNHPWLAQSLEGLATLLRATDRQAEADELAARAEEIRESRESD